MIITSYNILNPHHAVARAMPEGVHMGPTGKPYSNWPKRQMHIAKNLCSTNFDVAALQETNPTTCRDLQARFTSLARPYTVLGPAIHKHNKHAAAYGNALVYNSSTMQLEQLEEIESDTPQRRRALAGVFTEISTGQQLAVASVHLYGYSPNLRTDRALWQAQQDGFDELAHYQQALERKMPGLPTYVLAGDYNEDASFIGRPLSRIDLLVAQGYQHDGDMTPTEPPSGRRIDWIMAKGAQLTPVPLNIPHRTASDHQPIASRLAPGQ